MFGELKYNNIPIGDMPAGKLLRDGPQHVTYMLRIYGGEGGAEGMRIVMTEKTTHG